MLNGKQMGGTILGLLCGSFLFAATGQAQSQTLPASPAVNAVKDVALCADSTLEGRILDGTGQCIDGAIVVLRHGDQEISRTTSDGEGTYRFLNVESGVYQIDAANQSSVFRVWDNSTAPPTAQNSATVVTPTGVVRAQCGSCDNGPWGYTRADQAAGMPGTANSCYPPGANGQYRRPIGNRNNCCNERSLGPGVGAGFGIAGTALGITGTVVGAVALRRARNAEHEAEDLWEAIYYLSP